MPSLEWTESWLWGISFPELLRESSVLSSLEVVHLRASSCHITLQKALGFQVSLHLALGLIF